MTKLTISRNSISIMLLSIVLFFPVFAKKSNVQQDDETAAAACKDHESLFTDLYKNTVSSLVATICQHKAGECIQFCQLGTVDAYKLMLTPPTEMTLKSILDKTRTISDFEVSQPLLNIVNDMIVTDKYESADQLILNANTCLHFYGQLSNCHKALGNLVSGYKRCVEKSSKKPDDECSPLLRMVQSAFPNMATIGK